MINFAFMFELWYLIATPFVGLLLIFFLKNGERGTYEYGRVFNAAISFAGFNLILSVVLAFLFDRSSPDTFQFVSKKLGTESFFYNVGVDGLSLIFILLTNLLTLLCLMQARGSIESRPKLFTILFLMLQLFCIALFIVRDVVWFYIFFEAILVPMFLIIGIWGGKNRIYSSYKFFIYTFAGSVFFLLGMLFLIISTKTTDIGEMTSRLLSLSLPPATEKWLWIAFFISFAVKVPMFPFHTWLPDAHVEAPTSGSVILAGVLIKLGGYGMLRFSLPMFPSASLFFSDAVIILSIIAVLYGSFIAIMQEDIKKMIAYSSVAHMGFVTAGIFSLSQNGISAGVFQMFSHGLISGALFLCIGVLYERLHTREFAKFGGIAGKMPHFAIVLMVFTMASAGLPATSGFVGEFMAILAVYKASIYYAFFLTLSVIFGALYMLYMYKKTMFGEVRNQEVSWLSDLTFSEKISLYMLGGLVLFFGVYPSAILSLIPHLAVL